MNKLYSLAGAFVIFFLLTTEISAQCSGTYIILKMDDLKVYKNGTFKPQWQQFVDILKEKNIKGSVGIINETLSTASVSYLNWIKQLDTLGIVEFWHHGLDHKRNNLEPPNPGEFSGTNYTYQSDHFNQSMQLAKEKLGIVYHTFGAPYNKTDDTFIKVLNEHDNVIKVWLYGDPDADTDVLVLQRYNMHLEKRVGEPDMEAFMAGYERNRDKPYLVLQGHPGNWDASDFKEFNRIIDFLIKEGVKFVTPLEYYNIVQEQK